MSKECQHLSARFAEEIEYESQYLKNPDITIPPTSNGAQFPQRPVLKRKAKNPEKDSQYVLGEDGFYRPQAKAKAKKPRTRKAATEASHIGQGATRMQQNWMSVPVQSHATSERENPFTAQNIQNQQAQPAYGQRCVMDQSFFQYQQ